METIENRRGREQRGLSTVIHRIPEGGRRMAWFKPTLNKKEGEVDTITWECNYVGCELLKDGIIRCEFTIELKGGHTANATVAFKLAEGKWIEQGGLAFKSIWKIPEKDSERRREKREKRGWRQKRPYFTI